MPVTIPIGVALNLAYALFMVRVLPAIGYVAAPSLFLSAIGIALLLLDKRKPGAWLVIAGALPFVPLGLIAIVGARGVFDRLERERFFQGELPHARLG